eukprot:m.571298 g.571298  ORF g.571298 m.571298 type:complete len:213 (+) comp22266_c0_seq9:586-1224(+)
MAFLQSVTEAPESAMFKLTIDYDKDSFENKLDLGIGAYRDNDGNPYVLDVVKQASAMIQQKMESGDMNHEYLPIGGLPQFCKITAEFALGEDSPAVLENRAVAVQCLSGTGSLRTAGEFVAAFSPVKTILCSSPTWGNQAIFFSARMHIAFLYLWIGLPVVQILQSRNTCTRPRRNARRSQSGSPRRLCRIARVCTQPHWRGSQRRAMAANR